MKRSLLAAALLGLLFAPLASAASEGNIAIDGMELQGDASTSGFLELFHADGSMPLTLTGTAASVRVEQFERASMTPGGLITTFDPTYCKVHDGTWICHDVTEYYYEGVEMTGTSSDYTLQAFPYDGRVRMLQYVEGASITYAASALLPGGNGGHVEEQQAGFEDDMRDALGPLGGGPGGDESDFSSRFLSEESLIASAPQMTESTLQGDFVLELMGVEIELSSTTDDARFVSGTATEGDRDVVQFTRLYFQGANIDIHQRGGATSWAQGGMNIESAGAQVTLQGARGLLMDDGSEQQLNGEDYQFFSPIDAALDAESGALNAQFAGEQAAVDPSTQAATTSPTGWLMYALIAAGIVAAIGLGLFLRRRPSIQSIEALLEGGQYNRAAKVATRAIRREPTKESAHLARAIAWSRSGRPERVVDQLTRFIKRHDPSDGTLHYVLGLAHKDLGEEQAARQIMQEAVRRTPSLLSQIDPSVTQAGMDAHVYT